MNVNQLRSKWAAVGAAIAVSLGAGGIGITHATTSSGERPVYLPIEPCRMADTRPEFLKGPRATPLGADETYTLAGWGSNGDCNLPNGTAGLALNVTALDATAPTFLTIFPADATEIPTASNLNPVPGQPPTPNAVNVDLDGSGEFSVYNLAGNVNIIIDVVGIYDDHNHDDRYYQKGEVYTKGEVDGAVGAKANSTDVYTKGEVDSKTWSSASLTNEAGVAFSNKTDTTPNFGTTDVVVHTVRIRPPSSGFVTVRAALDWFSPTDGVQIRCQITDGTNTIDTSAPVVRDTSPDAGDLAQSLAVEATFSVSQWGGLIFSGQPFNLVCDSASGNSRIGDVIMSATFLPTGYGPFGIILPLADAQRLEVGS